MKLQRAEALGAAHYQRTSDRRGYANGYKPKTVSSRLGQLELSVPQARGVEFYPSVLGRGERSEKALKLAVAEMYVHGYVHGVSTRKVAAVTKELCGFEVSSAQVSRAAGAAGAAGLLDEELEQWRHRPLGRMPYLIPGARYEKVRHGGAVVDWAVLLAVGISPEGKRSVLGVSVSLSEAEVHWRDFLASLQDRGLHGVELIVSDDHAGLKAPRTTCPEPRCDRRSPPSCGMPGTHLTERPPNVCWPRWSRSTKRPPRDSRPGWTQAGQRRADRNLRRLGDRQALPQHGDPRTLETHCPASTAAGDLPKERCFIGRCPSRGTRYTGVGSAC